MMGRRKINNVEIRDEEKRERKLAKQGKLRNPVGSRQLTGAAKLHEYDYGNGDLRNFPINMEAANKTTDLIGRVLWGH
jgi:hypothetical protein